MPALRLCGGGCGASTAAPAGNGDAPVKKQPSTPEKYRANDADVASSPQDSSSSSKVSPAKGTPPTASPAATDEVSEEVRRRRESARINMERAMASSAASAGGQRPKRASASKISMTSDEDERKRRESMRGERTRRNSISSASFNPNNIVDLSDITKVEKSDDVMQRIKQAIEPHVLFKDLHPDTRMALIHSMSERKVKYGEHVITQGAEGEFFYIVDYGRLNCHVAPPGTEAPGKLEMQYGPGMAFGEVALMYNTPYSETIIANAESCLFAIEREVFRKLILASYVKKRNRLEESLDSISLFKSMSRYERNSLTDCFDEKTFQAGMSIINEGEPAKYFYVCLDGTCVATQTDASGNAVELRRFTAGEYFGEVALLRNATRAATVTCDTDCKCLTLDTSSFGRLMASVKPILERDAEGKHV